MEFVLRYIQYSTFSKKVNIFLIILYLFFVL